MAPPFGLTQRLVAPVDAELLERWRSPGWRTPRSSSTTPMWSTSRPARSSALREAGIGPRPISSGLTPATAVLTMRAIGSQPERPGPLGRRHQQRGGAVVEAGRVAGRDRAVLREGRPQLRQRFERGVGARVLVALDDDRLALRLRHGCAARSPRPAGRSRCARAGLLLAEHARTGPGPRGRRRGARRRSRRSRRASRCGRPPRARGAGSASRASSRPSRGRPARRRLRA